MEIVTREEAKKAGLREFFTGIPCKRGHIAPRLCRDGCCLICSREGRIKTARARRLAAGCIPKWNITPKERQERRKATLKRYVERNKDKVLESQKKYRANNPEKRNASKKKWAANNKDAVRLKQHRRRILAGGDLRVNKEFVSKALTLQKGLCVYCKKDIRAKNEIDHIVAIANGGLHEEKNLQLLCPPCNRAKSAKDHILFAQSRGYLL